MISVSVELSMQLAGQADVLVEGAAGLLPSSTSVTVLALIELGSIGPLKVMLIVHGVELPPALAADRVERCGRVRALEHVSVTPVT